MCWWQISICLHSLATFQIPYWKIYSTFVRNVFTLFSEIISLALRVYRSYMQY